MVTDIAMPVFSTLKLKSKQGLSLPVPARGQLHWLKRRVDEFRVFALVLNVDDEMCDVIPGSMDALQAGPDDIVLPRNIMGSFVMLSPGNIVTVPIESLGMGFARLDASVFNDIVEYSACLAEGKECEIAFSKGFPYLDEEDERIEYHQKMMDVFCAEQNGNWIKGNGTWNWETLEFTRDYAMAADDVPESESRCFKILVEAKHYELVLTLSREREMMDCCLYRDNGELAEEIDGWTVVARDDEGAIQVTIRRGLCDFPAEFLDNGVIILDENNKRVF